MESPTTVVAECIDAPIDDLIDKFNECNRLNDKLKQDLAEQKRLAKAEFDKLMHRDKLVITEEINLEHAKYILQNYSPASAMADVEGKTPKEYKGIETVVKNYCYNKILNKPDEAEYTPRPEGTPIKDSSRLYASKSLQGLPANVRNFLINKNCIDLDLENCHPKILAALAKKNGILTAEIDNYNNNRSNYLINLQNELGGVTKAEAKNAILKVFFSNPNKNLQPEHYKSECLKQIKREIKKIHECFQTIYKDVYRQAERLGKDNPNASALSKICQTEENRLLMKMYEHCYINNIKVIALMFDGILVELGSEDFSEDNFIDELEQSINPLGFDMKIKSKPISTSFKLPDDFVAIEINSYEELKSDFEQNNCKVDDDFFTTDSITQISKQYIKAKFKVKYEHIRYFCPKKNQQLVFIDAWLSDPDLRRYDATDIYPKQEMCPNNVFNLWIPFPIINHNLIDKSFAEDGLKFFREHLKVMSGNDADVLFFIELWIAQMLQYPEHKSIELIFFSREGAGKGLFLEFFKTILGRMKVFECTDPQNQIFGRFNSVMKDAFLVCMNETNKSYFYNNADRKKALITDPTIVIENKGVSSIVVNSFHRFIQFTNNPDPSPPSDRRNCFIEVSDEKIDDTEYFNKGFLFAAEKDVAKAIYDYYMSHPTKPKINKNDIPISEYHKEVLEANKDKMVCWLEEYAQGHDSVNLFVPTKHLLNDYREWLSNNNFKYDINAHQFGMHLKKRLNNNVARKVCRYESNIRSNGWDINFPALQSYLKKID